MFEDAFDLLMARLINDLSISFPADQFPATANSVGQLRLEFEREIRTKHILKLVGLDTSENWPNGPFVFAPIGGAVDETPRP